MGEFVDEWVRPVAAGTRDSLRGRDLGLTSAGVTFYAALAVVPTILAAVAIAAPLLGQDRLLHYADIVASLVPDALGASGWLLALTDAGLRMTLLGVVFAVVMATAYGEGLYRALRRLTPASVNAQVGEVSHWRIRAEMLPLVALAPVLLGVALLVAPLLESLAGRGGLGILAAGYVWLNAVWVLTWLPLSWIYRVVSPGRPRWSASFAGAMVAGAFVSGFLQGFLLFLALPVNLGRPFGGLVIVGVVSSLLLWLWVLHLVLLIGYAMTWVVDRQLAEAEQAPGQAVPSAA